MVSFELVVRVPTSWDDERVEDLASALGEVLDRFPGSSAEVRADLSRRQGRAGGDRQGGQPARRRERGRGRVPGRVEQHDPSGVG